MDEKGTCKKHGEFVLTEGCPQCLAEKHGEVEAEAREQVAMERLTGVGEEDLGPEEELEQTPFLKQVEEDIGAVELPAETAIALRPGEDIEAHGYFNEAMTLLDYAEARVIATAEDVKLATDDLALISKLKKVMENKRKSLLDPLKLQADAIRDTYNYLMTPVLEADKITREKMLAHDAEQGRIRQEQEEINRLREEAAQKQKELTGEITEVEIVEVAPEDPKRVSTEMGTAGQRDNWKWEVIDFALLPDEYKMVDGSLLTTVARSHHDRKLVPGVRFYNEPIIAVRAR